TPRRAFAPSPTARPRSRLIPLADVLAALRAPGPALRLRHARARRPAHLDGLAMPADHGEAVVARERRRVVRAQDGLLVAGALVRAAPRVVVHLIDLRRAAQQPVRIVRREQGPVRTIEI